MSGFTSGRSKSKEEDRLAEAIINITDSTFEQEVMKSELPVLVDFWAVWCGPCQMITPTMEYLAQAYHGKLKVTKLDVDGNIRVTSRYGVRSIPTLLLFKGGELKETMVGALPQDKIVSIISKHI
jgi:thioredoxin 1